MANPNEGSKLTKDGKVIAEIAVSPYGEPELSRPDQAAVYDNRGGKSTVAVNVLLPVKSIGALLPCTVYARLQQDGTVKFEPALPKGVKMSDDYRDIFRATVNKSLLAWSGWDRARLEAYKRLTAEKAPKDAKPTGAESIVWKPETAVQTGDKANAA